MTHASVLVTGTYLHDTAARRLAAAGYDAVYAHDCVSSSHLAMLAARHRVRGIIVRQGRIDEAVIAASPDLAVISRHGTGVDPIDVAAAGRRGVRVVRARGANARSVAEHAIGFVFSLVKSLHLLDRSVRDGAWIKQSYVGRDLQGMTLGIVGYGAVGQIVSRLGQALGLEVAIFDPKYTGAGRIEGARVHDCLGALARESGILTLHCPLTPATRHMIDAPLIELMPRGGYLVNTARGGLVDEAALVAALDAGHLAGAGLDTFEDEPLSPGHAFRGRADMILSPHVAGAGRLGMEAMATQSVAHLIAVLGGHPVPPEAEVAVEAPKRIRKISTPSEASEP